MTLHRSLLPPGWKRPRGYANGISASGRMVFTAGVVGWNEEEIFVADDLAGQFRQVLINTLAILAEDGGGAEHIVRMTWYIISRDDYLTSLPEIAQAYREIIGKNYPAMAVVEVTALVEASARVEIETIAVIPN